MISIRFEEKQQIGLQYALETLHGCSPFGQEKIRRLRFYTPAERAELEEELYNVQQAADHAEELKGVYDKICILLCQMKDIRNSIRRCRDGEVPDHVELFEIKGYLQRLESLLPLYQQISDTAPLRGLAFHDPKPALDILDPDNTRSRGFYIPDSMTEKLRQIRRSKKALEEKLHEAKTDAQKDELRLQRTRICAEEESEETKIRRDMGARLAPLAEAMLADAGHRALADYSKALNAFCLAHPALYAPQSFAWTAQDASTGVLGFTLQAGCETLLCALNTGTQAVQGFGLKLGWGSCALPLFAAGWVDNAPRPIANGWLALDLAPLSGGIWQIE